ncbi:MAG: lyase family protein, partial [Alteromonas sp.]
MTTHRIESDSMGDVKIPIEANYGAQTQRAINNFKISNRPLPEQFIRALITLKIATANANFKLDRLTPCEHRPIVNAAEQLLNDQSLLAHFPVDVFQTGSGTSSNMNANEVIANLAN